jgi:hypothetical protein
MKKMKKNNQWNGPIPINNNSSKSTTNQAKTLQTLRGMQRKKNY